MKLAIVGSRSFQDYPRLQRIMAKLKTPVELLISGGADGADLLAERYAKQAGLSMLVHYPNRQRDGARCFAVRNQKIVDDADAVIAFWDGLSRGTKMTIDKARRAGKKVHIVYYEPA